MYDNLNNYRVFYTVAKTKNISKAAKTLYISQPAISKSISKLESGLGIKLFERTSKGVDLTDEGEILYNHISNAFDTISRGEDEIKRINELGIGQIKIGVSTSLCKHILLDYLKSFIEENPHIKVVIDCHSTLNTIKLLQDGDIDIGLICHTDLPNGYKYSMISSIHDIFVANNSYLENLSVREQEDLEFSGNPWLPAGNLTSLIPSQNKSPLPVTKLTTREIIEKSNLMLMEKNNITRSHIDSYLEKECIYPNQILEINNMDLLIDFASIGMGVASVVREFATDALSRGDIIELPLDTPIKERTVGFVYSELKPKSPAFEKFISFCHI